jgi:hypothetical protein
MPNFIEIYGVVLETEHADGQADMVSPVHFMQIIRNNPEALVHM